MLTGMRTVPQCRVQTATDAGPTSGPDRVNFDRITKVLPDFKPRWDVDRGVRESCANRS